MFVKAKDINDLYNTCEKLFDHYTGKTLLSEEEEITTSAIVIYNSSIFPKIMESVFKKEDCFIGLEYLAFSLLLCPQNTQQKVLKKVFDLMKKNGFVVTSVEEDKTKNIEAGYLITWPKE